MAMQAVGQTITPVSEGKYRAVTTEVGRVLFLDNTDRTPRKGARFLLEFTGGSRRVVICEGLADPKRFVSPQKLWRVVFDNAVPASDRPKNAPVLMSDLIPEEHFRQICLGCLAGSPPVAVGAERKKSAMNEIVPFEFEGAGVRVIKKDGEPWFVAADVCQVLNISNSRDATQKLDDDEKGVALTDTLGGQQNKVIINEAGLYTLVLRCRDAVKPGTRPHRFRKWVTSEVLPAIRKTGHYGAADPVAVLNDPAAMRGLLLNYSEKVLTLESKVGTLAPKADFYDRFADADGCYTLQNAGRVLGLGPNRFVRDLKAGYLFYQGGHLVPKAYYRDMGIFEVKATVVNDKAYYQTYVTPKGLQYLAKKLDCGISEDLFARAG